MQVTDLSNSLTITDLMQVAASPRSPGLHLSDVIKQIMKTVNRGKTTSYWNQDETEPGLDAYLQFEKGFIWEEAFGDYWALRQAGTSTGDRQLIIQQEIELDGILMTPDFLEIGNTELTVIETKCSARSSAKIDQLEEHFMHWLIQVMGYCHFFQTTRAILAVFFLCGNYRPPAPQVKILELRFGQQELRDNWNLVLRTVDMMKAEGLV